MKIIKSGSSIPISDVLPMLENFGLRVLAEHPYEVLLQDGELASVQDLEPRCTTRATSISNG
ncbi:MAG: NAD-glutamate dehydrogenase [Planctomycetes bacterium]|nr:NAD-glutamate dehydrogenase [Planctomycetota bacterium]